METMEITEYLPPDKQREISADLADVSKKANDVVVHDQESMDKANNWLTWINDRQKGIEALRLAIVKPLKDHIKKIDNFFNGLSGQFDEPKELITNKVVVYRELLARKARKKHQDEPIKTTNHDLGQVTYRKYAEFEIRDRNLVPSEFWCIDEKKLGARVRELTKDLEVGKVYKDKIKGVVIICTERPSIGRE